MKKEKQARRENSAAESSNQTSNPAQGKAPNPNRPEIRSILVPNLAPAYPYKDDPEFARRKADKMNQPVYTNLYLWACGELSDVECVHYISVIIAENADALMPYALSHWGENKTTDRFGENLVLIKVAKALSQSTVKALDEQAKRGNFFFPSLPGLLGRKFVPLKDLLEHFSVFVWNARQEILNKIIPEKSDRAAALRLAEALIIAELVSERNGYDTKGFGSTAFDMAEHLLGEAIYSADTVENGGAQ